MLLRGWTRQVESAYYKQVIQEVKSMHSFRSKLSSRRGITVLSLLLLIIALVIAAVFLVRYLRTRPAVSSGPTHVILASSAV
jgi:flagellar biogenesis protein FliO